MQQEVKVKMYSNFGICQYGIVNSQEHSVKYCVDVQLDAPYVLNPDAML